MDLIVTHTNADFDALASMVAASLLYPLAKMSLPGGADRNVREFLSLHGEMITLTPPAEVDLQHITRLIIVETQQAKRIGNFSTLLNQPGIEIILYDHHAPQPPVIKAGTKIIKGYGANITIMLQAIQQRGIEISALHATLFALGIYEDTGSMTFSTTCPEDIEMAAWLLRKGANLDMVSSFMNRVLTERQRKILTELLANAEDHAIQGIHILLATADAGENVDELALLAHKVRDLAQCDALVLLIKMDEAVLLVARSQIDAVNVGALARSFGGGGHDRAASATIHHREISELKAQVIAALPQAVHPLVLAKNIMSHPVRTVSPDATLDDAHEILLHYGFNGLTVSENGQVVGIINRRDVDRARHHNLGHAPVRGYMSRRVFTITPDTPLQEIERLIIEQDVGRLPVLKAGKLAGIVSRTDVLRALHGKRALPEQLAARTKSTQNLLEKFNQGIQNYQHEILKLASEEADKQGATLFLVGGAVRDLLLGEQQLDIDILVEGEGIPIAEAVGKKLGHKIILHPKFHTGKLQITLEEHLDFASARSEYYPHPAALPEAEHSSVREDLFRRDFSINAMALQLNGKQAGQLLDPFHGRRDLQGKVVRVLHNLSFIEDPTRILRAVRFETRFAFKLDEESEKLARHAIELSLLDKLSGERLRSELLQISALSNPEAAWHRLADLDVLSALEKSWKLPAKTNEFARQAAVLSWFDNEESISKKEFDRPLLRLLLLFTYLKTATAARLSLRLSLHRNEEKAALTATKLPNIAKKLCSPNILLSKVDDVLHNLHLHHLLLLMAITANSDCQMRLKEYLLHWRNLAPLLSSRELIKLGVPENSRFGKITRQLRAAQLDKLITTREEAIALVEKAKKRS